MESLIIWVHNDQFTIKNLENVKESSGFGEILFNSPGKIEILTNLRKLKCAEIGSSLKSMKI